MINVSNFTLHSNLPLLVQSGTCAHVHSIHLNYSIVPVSSTLVEKYLYYRMYKICKFCAY
jgi:hypothetical protein